MAVALQIIVGVWLAWAALCSLALLVSPFLAGNAGTAMTNGLIVRVPEFVRQRLTPSEVDALVAHEHGHMRLGHPLENLISAWLFIRRTPARAGQQELEADDWAAKRIDPRTLARAIRRLSVHPFDLYRAERLDQIAARQAGNSAA